MVLTVIEHNWQLQPFNINSINFNTRNQTITWQLHY